jgi:hypothetical protein
MKLRLKRKLLLNPLTFVLFVFLYNEYLIYWQTFILGCGWPKWSHREDYVNVMLLADTHLLGSRNGHWFDKLRREWQQQRAFQTAQFLLKPNVVVILGDLTDEGKWCSDREVLYCFIILKARTSILTNILIQLIDIQIDMCA